MKNNQKLDSRLHPRCCKCKTPTEPRDVVIVKQGQRYNLRGVCTICKTNQFRFLSKTDGEELSTQYPTREEAEPVRTPKPRKSKRCEACGHKQGNKIKKQPEQTPAKTPSAPRKCTLCRLPGHMKNKCPGKVLKTEQSEKTEHVSPPLPKKKRIIKRVIRKKKKPEAETDLDDLITQ